LPWYKLLFDERPKQKRKDLYDFEPELGSLSAAVKRRDPLIVLVGLRRTGKTSLLLTALNEISRPSVVVDLRALASQAYGTRKDLLQEFERALNSFLAKYRTITEKLVERLKKMKGVEVTSRGISLTWGGKERVDLVMLFSEIDRWASSQGEQALIAFDEAQELRKIAGVDVAKLLAYCYDHCRHVTSILTGSSIGLLYDFLGDRNPHAPLYGRSRTEIRIGRLTPDRAKDFLLQGFKQGKLRSDVHLIDRAVERLDGIIGWLTAFGATCLKEGLSETALDYCVETGKALAKREFENFLAGREAGRCRYVKIVRRLAKEASSWSAIKGSLEAREGRAINDRNLTELLTTLVKAGFVEKKGEQYQLADPILAETFG
jgi:AAA+ ATPase superfamily predicted ATPase